MNATHIHLALTHFPIIGTLIGIGILAWGLISKNNAIKKVALATFILMAIIAIPVFLTGEEAEETVEHIAGVSEYLIEEHEELAEVGIWLIEVLGLLSLINLFVMIRKTAFSKMVTIATFGLSLVTFGVFAQVGNLGGKIRHSEIRGGATTVQQKQINQVQQKSHDDDDDD